VGYPVATRLRCSTCGAEFVVVEAGEGTIECCGVPLAASTGARAQGRVDAKDGPNGQ
jgi:hypothetical protein